MMLIENLCCKLYHGDQLQWENKVIPEKRKNANKYLIITITTVPAIVWFFSCDTDTRRTVVHVEETPVR